MTGAACLCRDGRAPRRRRLRDARGARGVARRPPRSLALEPVKVGWSRRRRGRDGATRPRSERRRSRSGRGSAAVGARRALVRELLERVDLPAVVDADALFGLEPVERDAADGPHSARRRARAPARHATPPGSTRTGSRPLGPRRSASARSCSSRGRHASSPRRTATSIVCDLGPPSLATAGNGRRPHGRRRRIPREGARRARPRPRPAAVAHGRAAQPRPAPDRARRERPARAAPRSARAADDPDRSQTMTAWSGRASPSTSGRSAGTPRRCCVRPRAPSCGRSSRRRGTGTARSTSRRRRSRRCDRALRRDAARGAPPSRGAAQRAHPRHGACLRARDRRGARRAARARRRGRADPGGRARAPQARHRDGALGARGAPGTDARRRRRDEPSRVRRVRPGVHARSRSSGSARRRRRSARSRATSRTAPRRCATRRRASMRFAAGSRSTGSRRSARDPADDGLEPALRWESYLALVKRLEPGESTGYGRRFVADRADLDRRSCRSDTPTASAAT